MAGNSAGGRGVKSDETLFAIIEAVREADGIGVTELAANVNLAKSSVHKHLSTMRDHGFVVKRNGEYHLGLEFFSYGQYTRTTQDVYSAALPALEEIASETGESTWLMTHENGQVMYLDGRDPNDEINVNALVGSWEEMHANSGGKVILAHLRESEVNEIVERHGLSAKTDETITDRATLEEELERVRERGYALNLGEGLREMNAVAVPLISQESVEGALSVAGPTYRVKRERCEGELLDRLRAAADDIGLSLAY
ncbi:IclR family transcriptional regulator [Natrarchaeobius oligotrophus]|uniref:IclR family transcriptional regulator n=1 Tax=Natrarchaeobius chitinivorans TaxID=1679083 RepID=A0A3N6MX12_NATCH|nr:IclR family transcriptional regulator [Natrarchaeobius chitinivorans]RQH02551.1 IclR family transcriptional regulator [Natrarchaeobius chitinivorans]